MTRTEIDPAELRARIAQHPRWHHQIELAPGVVTPGAQSSARALADLQSLGLPADARGLRVLDVGCRDGFFAFELERRGAEVLGIDYVAPDKTGFEIASRALGSRVRYELANVYDLAPERFGLFDVVLCLGVLYHLRNPLLALDAVRSVVRPEGSLFFETLVTTDPKIAALEEPVWQFLPRDTLNGDWTNKWAPNLPGLVKAIEECQIQVEQTLWQPGGDRAWVRGRAVTEKALDYFRRVDRGIGLGI